MQLMLDSFPEEALRCRGLLRLILQIAPLTKKSDVSATRAEEAMCKLICQGLQAFRLEDTQIDSRLSDFGMAPPPMSERIKATLGLLEQARRLASQLDKLEEAESLTIAPNQFLNLEYGLKQSCHLRDLLLKRPAVWAQLSKGEDALIQPIQAQLQALKIRVEEAILKAQQEREEREYKEEKMRHETEKTQNIPKAQQAAETLRGLLEKSSMVFNATAPAVRDSQPSGVQLSPARRRKQFVCGAAQILGTVCRRACAGPTKPRSTFAQTLHAVRAL